MSDVENPYQSPETQIVQENSQNTGVVLTDNMLRYLKEASPWLRFIGILGFINCGLMVFGGLIGSVSSVFMTSLLGELGEVFPLWIYTLIYLPMGVLYFFPALYTYNFGVKIRNYNISRNDEELESAFKNNKSLWKFIGILCIIIIALIPLFIIGAIIFTVIAATTGIF